MTRTRREKQKLRGEVHWRDVDLERTIQKSGKLVFGGTTENTESRVNRIVNPSVLGKDQERTQYRDAEGCKGKRSKKGRDNISFSSHYMGLYISVTVCTISVCPLSRIRLIIRSMHFMCVSMTSCDVVSLRQTYTLPRREKEKGKRERTRKAIMVGGNGGGWLS